MSRLTVRFAALALVFSAGTALAVAQGPARQGGGAGSGGRAAEAAGTGRSDPARELRLRAEGRRDPFVALIGKTGEQRGVQRPDIRAEGLPGIGTDELAVRGIIQSQGAWVAMVSGPSGKVYTVRPGDRLADGTIRTITAQAVIIQQQVNDPLSLEKQREVRKFLRGGENK